MFHTFFKATRHSRASVKTSLQNPIKGSLSFCSMMLFEFHNRSKSLTNNSTTTGFIWEKYDFEQCDNFEGGKYIWVFCISLIFVLGFPASTAIVWEMFKAHRRGAPFTPNSFFIMNLSIMDFVFLAFIPAGIFNHLIWKIWLIEASWNGIYTLSTCGRPLLTACICLDCYLAVVHPITYHKQKSLTPRVVMAGIVWTLTVASGIAYFLFYKLYATNFSIIPYMIAIVIIVICDSFILHVLVKSESGRKYIHPQKQRAIQTLVNSLVMTVFSYLPPVILMPIGNSVISNFTNLHCAIGLPITITSTSGSAIMPILHLNNNGKLNCFKLAWCRKS